MTNPQTDRLDRPIGTSNAHAYLYGDEPFRQDQEPDTCRDCGTAWGARHLDVCLNAWCATCGDQACLCPHGDDRGRGADG